MKILFIGQKGVPAKAADYSNIGRERRVEALAMLLSGRGDDVFVTCARPYVSSNLTKYNGVNLLHRSSLLPDTPGGWLYDFLSVLSIKKVKPEVVHVQGWRAAALSLLAVVLVPETTYVWTVDVDSSGYVWLKKRLAKIIESLFDAVTASSRETQYLMLYKYGVRAMYIPDGYESVDFPLLPAKHFGIRSKDYTLAIASDAKGLRNIAKAYKKAGGRRKMVVASEEKGQFKRLKREFKFLHFVGEQGGRPLYSLIDEAGLIIMTGGDVGLDTILRAMDSGKAIVATNDIRFQEVLGVSASMAAKNNVEGLAEVVVPFIRSERKRNMAGKKAGKRAQAHFTWQRILPEYVELYHYPLLKVVAIDSAVPKMV